MLFLTIQLHNFMEAAWAACKQAVVAGKRLDSEKFPVCPEVLDVGKKVSDRCRKAFDEDEQARKEDDLSDEHLSRIARYTDGFPLQNYVNMFGLVPELVNVVTVGLLRPTHHLPSLTHGLRRAVGRSHTGQGLRRHAAARPTLHCLPDKQLLLCPSEICCSSVGVLIASVQNSDIS
jgi:hypothetical protein